MKAIFFKSASEFRAWLETNHQHCPELSVGFYKRTSGHPSITWPEAVDQALCYGWINGVRKRIDDEAYSVRFTPRKPKSKWSAVNIRRAQELTQLGNMKPPGLKAFAGAEGQPPSYSYEQRRTAQLEAAAETQFRANKKAWAFFQGQPPWYRRTTAWWVLSAKKEETRQRRLAQLIADSGQGRRILQVPERAVPKRQRK
ncbi:MAG: YdeI/OmpD-associated family protein [Candidatus Sulfotelmatobacter sp.]